VTGYRIYRGGVLVGTSTYGSFSDSGLTAGTSYTYTVAAYDAQDNVSAQTGAITVKTQMTGTQTRNVTDVVTLTTALEEAAANPSATFTINLAAGTYKLGASALPAFSGNNTKIQGPEGDGASAVIDCAARTDGPVFSVSGSYVYFIGLEFINVRSNAITIQYGAYSGVIANCVFDCVSTSAAIKGFACSGWFVAGNAINGVAGSVSTAEPAIYFVNGATYLEISYNLILNCDRGIGAGSSSYEYVGPIWIENNMIANNLTTGFTGPGIRLEGVNTEGASIDNNSVYQSGSYANAIEYVRCSYPVRIRNNLVNKAIVGSESPSAIVSNNNSSAVAAWFKDVSGCDLRLTGSITGVVDAGIAITGLTNDIEGDLRPSGAAYDIGADEYMVASTPVTPAPAPGNAAGGSSGGGGGGAPSGWFFGALLVLSLTRRLNAKDGRW
jgi:hypothetical protein